MCALPPQRDASPSLLRSLQLTSVASRTELESPTASPPASRAPPRDIFAKLSPIIRYAFGGTPLDTDLRTVAEVALSLPRILALMAW